MVKPLVVPKWPTYSIECRQAMDALLANGGPMSAYRANKAHGVEPAEGSWARRLECKAEDKFHVKHAVAVNSGTAALVAALRALDVKDKEVVTTPYSFSATVSAIILAGGIPVFADVDLHTYCITLETVRPLVSKKTRAILPVHLFGLLPDLSPLMSLEIPIIEDACQAVGASREGKYAGTYGIAGCYSFQGGKQCPAGEGGMVITNNSLLAETIRQHANHAENFDQEFVGENYRPPEMTCLLAWFGLKELQDRLNERRSCVAGFMDNITTRRFAAQIWNVWEDHAFYVFGFTQNKMPSQVFRAKLYRLGIPSGAGYITPPLHHYKAFGKYAKKALPNVDELSFRSLGILDCLRPGIDIQRIADAFNKVLG